MQTRLSVSAGRSTGRLWKPQLRAAEQRQKLASLVRAYLSESNFWRWIQECFVLVLKQQKAECESGVGSLLGTEAKTEIDCAGVIIILTEF